MKIFNYKAHWNGNSNKICFNTENKALWIHLNYKSRHHNANKCNFCFEPTQTRDKHDKNVSFLSEKTADSALT